NPKEPARARLQGQSPGLYRPCSHWPACEHRCRYHYLQLRRCKQGPDHYRGRCLHRVGYAIDRAGTPWPWGHAGSRHHLDQRRPRGPVDDLATGTADYQRLGTSSQEVLIVPDATRSRPRSSNLPDGLPTPERYWAALGLLLAITITVLDS